MQDIEKKAAEFLLSLANAYKDEEQKESICKLDINTEDFTEDMTAILLAAHLFMEEVSGFDNDLIGFTHLLNRLAIQYCMSPDKEV